jgi:hypothetical protein
MDFDGVCLKTQRGEEKVVFEGRTYRKKNPNEPPYFSSSKHTLTTYYVCCLNPKICHGAAKQTVQTDELGTPVSDPEFTCNESTHDLGCVPDHAQVGREQARVLVECRVLKGELS